MSILGFPNLLEDCAQIKISNPSKWVTTSIQFFDTFIFKEYFYIRDV